MFRDEANALCQRIAVATLGRIREDRRRVSVRVGQLLQMIEEKLLDADLQVDSLRRWCGANDNNVSTQFKKELGLAPWAYITQGRMEIAGRMLAGSELAVWRIGLAVGYLSGHSFGRAFKRWCGQSPKQFRAASRADGEEASRIPNPAAPLSREEIRRALAGDLPTDEAEDLFDRLGGLREQISANYGILGPQVPGAESVEPVMARSLWRWIKRLPPAVQMAAIESQAPAFHTPVLFHVLCTRSIEAGDDGDRALHLANLALASLQPVAERLGRAAGNSMVRSHVVAGYAYSRAGKVDEAAEAFAYATRMLEVIGEEAHPVVVLELCLYQATLEIQRDRYREAAALIRMTAKLQRALVAKLKQQAASGGAEK